MPPTSEPFLIFPPLYTNVSYAHRRPIPSYFGNVSPLASQLSQNDDLGFVFRTHAFRRAWVQTIQTIQNILDRHIDTSAKLIDASLLRSSCTEFSEVPLIFARAGVDVADHKWAFTSLRDKLRCADGDHMGDRSIPPGLPQDVQQLPFKGRRFVALLSPSDFNANLDSVTSNILQQYATHVLCVDT
eukprot:Lankesteria_metandrocarpae@DN6053_c0_g1_i1.p1